MATIPSISLPEFELPELPSLPKLPDLALPELAVGTFTGGPKAETATADIYKMVTGAGGNSPITSIQQLNILPNTSLFDKLDGSSTADFLSKSKEGLKFDSNLLTNRLLGAQDEFKLQFGQLTESMKKGALLDTFKDKAKYVLTTLKDTNSLVKAAKIGDVKALGNFINKYTNSKDFGGKDKGAIGGLLGSVVTTASDLGVSGVFTTLAATVNDKGIVGRITRAVMPTVLRNSDSKILKELTSGTAGKLINVISPGFTQQFAKGFKTRNDRSKPLKSFDDVLTSFKNIDSQWDKMSRGGEGNVATNLLSLISGSKDFQSLISTGVKHYVTEANSQRPTPVPIDPMHGLITAYQEVTVSQAIQRDFPKVALLNLYNGRLNPRTGQRNGTRNSRNANVIDPRLVNSTLGALFGY